MEKLEISVASSVLRANILKWTNQLSATSTIRLKRKARSAASATVGASTVLVALRMSVLNALVGTFSRLKTPFLRLGLVRGNFQTRKKVSMCT